MLGANSLIRMPLADALATGREAWDCPSANGRQRSPFMSWTWYRAWADVASEVDVEHSEIVALERAGKGFGAVCPVTVRRMRFGPLAHAKTLTWPSRDIGAPDHLDLLAHGEMPIDELVPGLEALPWDVMVFPNVAQEAPNMRALLTAFQERGYRVRHRLLWGCPYLDLPASWDDYLSTLSSTRRQTFRRKERKLAREHDVELVEYGAERFDEGWEHLLRLHGLRWEDGSAFQGAGVDLHRAFAKRLADLGKLWLFTLNVDGVPAAAWYGFAWDRTVYFYQAGRDPEWERKSVGIILMNMMIRRAIEQGYTRFDFMRGEENYKMRWTDHQRMCYEWVVFRPGLKGWWLRGQYRLKRWRAHLRYWREQRKRVGNAGE